MAELVKIGEGKPVDDGFDDSGLGVNVTLYGDGNQGKSELCKRACKHYIPTCKITSFVFGFAVCLDCQCWRFCSRLKSK